MIDEKRIADFFAELVSINSPSLEEREMADTLKIKFAEIGVTLTEDHTQEQTGSNAGNLFARIPGSLAGAPVLFAAHMDTVEPAKGKKAVSHEDGTVTSDGTTVLGADDLAGVTAIYEVVRHIIETKTPHRPIEILISTGEELYCKGANAFNYSQVQAKEAYVLDLSGAIGAAAYAAPTLVSFAAKIQGKAAHAGFHPEDGINSIQAAARAIAQLPQATWMKHHCQHRKNRRRLRYQHRFGKLRDRRRNSKPEPRDGHGASGNISQNLPAGSREDWCEAGLGRKAEYPCV